MFIMFTCVLAFLYLRNSKKIKIKNKKATANIDGNVINCACMLS